jgi:hypothetical protein
MYSLDEMFGFDYRTKKRELQHDSGLQSGLRSRSKMLRYQGISRLLIDQDESRAMSAARRSEHGPTESSLDSSCIG